jgi:hypothetical protein
MQAPFGRVPLSVRNIIRVTRVTGDSCRAKAEILVLCFDILPCLASRYVLNFLGIIVWLCLDISIAVALEHVVSGMYCILPLSKRRR